MATSVELVTTQFDALINRFESSKLVTESTAVASNTAGILSHMGNIVNDTEGILQTVNRDLPAIFNLIVSQEKRIENIENDIDTLIIIISVLGVLLAALTLLYIFKVLREIVHKKKA